MPYDVQCCTANIFVCLKRDGIAKYDSKAVTMAAFSVLQHVVKLSMGQFFRQSWLSTTQTIQLHSHV